MPKIIIEDIPTRASVPEPQMAEQLVEVPTVISCSSLQRSVEQLVDIPVPGGGGPSFGLQGFSSGQSSTASPFKKRISERIVEQIVDPVSSGRLLGSLPGHGSSSSHSPTGVDERADEPGEGVFRTFPHIKKVRSWARTRGRNCSPSLTTGTDALERLPGSHRLASRWCGSAKGMRPDWTASSFSGWDRQVPSAAAATNWSSEISTTASLTSLSMMDQCLSFQNSRSPGARRKPARIPHEGT